MQKYSPTVSNLKMDIHCVPDIGGKYYLASEADAKIAKLKEALQDYGTHNVVCSLELGTGECDCGFEELKRSL